MYVTCKAEDRNHAPTTRPESPIEESKACASPFSPTRLRVYCSNFTMSLNTSKQFNASSDSLWKTADSVVRGSAVRRAEKRHVTSKYLLAKYLRFLKQKINFYHNAHKTCFKNRNCCSLAPNLELVMNAPFLLL